MLTQVYRKPTCQINATQLQLQGWLENRLIIFKKFFLKNENRFMTFKEIFDCGAHNYFYTHKFEEKGIQLVENTPEEILDVSLEMVKRLEGTWEESSEDKDLQKAFRSLIPKSDFPIKFRSNIGSKFLRDNQDLLNT
jgi:putative glycosyltransferase (TIGR04372 family)